MIIVVGRGEDRFGNVREQGKKKKKKKKKKAYFLPWQ